MTHLSLTRSRNEVRKERRRIECMKCEETEFCFFSSS
jgi:hypothetical protein